MRKKGEKEHLKQVTLREQHKLQKNRKDIRSSISLY